MKKIFGIVALLMLLILAACGNTDGVSNATDSRYSELEIKEYEGTRLDPSVGPRDNSINGIQKVAIEDYELKLTGLVDSPKSLKYEEITGLTSYEKLITLHCVEGWDATILWKGALITDIVDLAGGKKQAKSIIFHCVDGYSTMLPLADIREKKMILAYASNDITLPSALGYPFIVVAEDKLGYKWARWVNEIELSSDTDYLGYWEKRGYDNKADI